MTDRRPAFPPPTSEAAHVARFRRATVAAFLAFLSWVVAARRNDNKEQAMSNSTPNNQRTQGKGKIRKPKLSAPGQRRRRHREEQLFNALVEEHRRDRKRNGLPKSEAACRAYAEKEFQRRLSWSRTPSGKDLGYRLPLSKVSEYPDFVKVKALRDSDIGQELNAILRSRPKLGRPANHNLAVAILEMLLWSGEHQTLRRCHQEFQKLDQSVAYTYGLGPGDLVGYKAVCNAIGGDIRPDRTRRPGLCDLITEDFVDQALVEVAKQFTKYAGEDFDIAASIDGTLIRAAADQRQSFSKEDEAHIDRGRGTAYASHGDDEFIRGYLAVALNLHSCNIPIAVKVYPANQYEAATTMPLIERTYDLWDDLAINYLVGDAAFDREAEVHRDLQQLYGITLVAQRFDRKKQPPHLAGRGFVEGIPVCRCMGAEKFMTIVKPEGFWGPAKRAKMGLKPGQDAAPLKRRKRVKQRICFKCEVCGLGSSFSVSKLADWRWASPVPHRPIHKRRYAIRQELMAYRNGVESAWNAMKKTGPDASGPMVARWTRTEHQNHIYIKMKALRFALLKLLELDGTLSSTYEDAIRSGVLVPLRADEKDELAA